MPFKVMHRKEVKHSNGSYVRKSRGQKLADEMGRAKKNSHGTLIDWCTGREWPLNCMAVISAWWLLNIRFQRSSGRRTIIQFSWVRRASGVASRVPDCWRGDVVGKATPDRGALGNPDGVWGPEKMLIRCSKESQHPAEWALGLRLSSPREQERHNVTVITVGSKYYSLCSVSSSLS